MSDRIKMRLLESELRPYSGVLSKAYQTILDQDVSNYPIFVVHQHQVDMGLPLVDKESHKGNWSINASTLEEFVTKNIIQQEKIEEFKKVFFDQADQLCLFVLSELGAQFIFIPKEFSNPEKKTEQ